MLLCDNEGMRQCESVTSHIDMPLTTKPLLIVGHILPPLAPSSSAIGRRWRKVQTTASALNTRSRFSTFTIGTFGGGMLKDLPGLLAAAAFMP